VDEPHVDTNRSAEADLRRTVSGRSHGKNTMARFRHAVAAAVHARSSLESLPHGPALHQTLRVEI